MNPLSPENIVATYITVVTAILIVGVAAIVLLTAGDDGGVHRPRWPARYPYAERHKAKSRAARMWAWAVRS